MDFESFRIKKDKLAVKSHEEYMGIAITAAKAAKSKGFAPIGACLAFTSSHLSEHSTGDVLRTAGINVIRKAMDMLPYKVPNSVLYCTVEPDALTALAAYKSGINEIVFGAFDPKNGFVSSTSRNLNPELCAIKQRGGVLANECCELLSEDMREYCETDPQT